MINLVGHQRQRQLRSARINSILRRYLVMMMLLGLFVASTLGGGYYLLSQQRAVANSDLEQANLEKAKFGATSKKLQTYQSDLQLAKKILADGVPLSNYITTVASTLPQGAVVSSLSVSATHIKDPLSLTLSVKSSDVAVDAKEAFEASPYFEDVKILSVTSSTSESGTSSYKYIATLNLKVTASALSQLANGGVK